MKLVYYSSVLNHHQKCLCDEFYKYYGDEFRFITTMEMEQQRIELGYKPENAPYLFESFRSDDRRRQAIQMAIESDVLLAAVFPVEILHERMRRNRLTFRHIETYFKSGKYKLLSPNAMRIAYSEHMRYRNRPLYLLCASSHTASDVKLFGGYPGKKLRWGYFPEITFNASDARTNDSIELLWAGRFIKWKEPEYALEVAVELHNKGIPVHLNMIGTGPMEQQLKELVRKQHAEQIVDLCGVMTPAQVRQHMRDADIYLFTSTREEGWGAVLNEAMGCGCAVVASSEAGSTGYLLPNSSYGLTYRHNRYGELLAQVERLCQNRSLMEQLKVSAEERIATLWNYQVAAKRFIEMSEGLLHGNAPKYTDDGPMSEG